MEMVAPLPAAEGRPRPAQLHGQRSTGALAPAPIMNRHISGSVEGGRHDGTGDRLQSVVPGPARNCLARLAGSLARHQDTDPDTLADALLADLLPPGGLTDDTALVIVRL
jgi:hypothetical protein